MSMAGVLAYRPDRSQAKLVFQTRPGSYNTESLIEFLTELRRHLRGKPVVLIWDGLSAHRSRDMKAWQATQRHWLVVEQLPSYAHDLNPLELVWGNLKATELANRLAHPRYRVARRYQVTSRTSLYARSGPGTNVISRPAPLEAL